MEQDLKRKVIALRDQWQADRVVAEKANTCPYRKPNPALLTSESL